MSGRDVEDELSYIGAGEVRFVCGDTNRTVGPGGTVWLPKGLPHRFQVVCSRRRRALSYLLAEAADAGGADPAVHGHAHHGTEHGRTSGGVSVRNVAEPVIGAAFRIYDVE